MNKVKMRDLIVYMLEIDKSENVLVSSIKATVRSLIEGGKAIASNDFDDQLECILSVVQTEKDMFEITHNGSYIRLLHPEKIGEYVACCDFCDDVRTAIEECVNELCDPLVFSIFDVGQAEENEHNIKKDKTYIEWLINFASQNEEFCDTDYHLAKDGKDLANLTMISNLFNVVSKYCGKNLIASYFSGNGEAFNITYRIGNEYFYIRLIRSELLGITVYKVRKFNKLNNAVYFPDIALDVSSGNVESRQKVLDNLEKKFQEAKKKMVPYNRIKDVLDKVYSLKTDIFDED